MRDVKQFIWLRSLIIKLDDTNDDDVNVDERTQLLMELNDVERERLTKFAVNGVIQI